MIGVCVCVGWGGGGGGVYVWGGAIKTFICHTA